LDKKRFLVKRVLELGFAKFTNGGHLLTFVLANFDLYQGVVKGLNVFK
jgi:hypothetical protein